MELILLPNCSLFYFDFNDVAIYKVYSWGGGGGGGGGYKYNWKQNKQTWSVICNLPTVFALTTVFSITYYIAAQWHQW